MYRMTWAKERLESNHSDSQILLPIDSPVFANMPMANPSDKKTDMERRYFQYTFIFT